MLVAEWLKELIGKNFNFYLLGVIFLILAAGAVASILANRRDARLGITHPVPKPPQDADTETPHQIA
jgi:hypothetical protein